MTRMGWGSLVLAGLLSILGLLCSWPAILLVGIVVLAMVGGSRVYVLRRPDLTIERDIQPSRVTKGLPAIAYLSMTNNRRTSMPSMVARQPYGNSTVRTVLPKLLGGQSGVRTYRLPTVRRGIFTIGPVELTRADPFGFARVAQSYTRPTDIWVYPRILPFASLSSGISQDLEGPTTDQAQDGSIAFHRLREYVQGDDLRMVHWKSFAKTGKLVIRQNVDTSLTQTLVLLDLDPRRYSAETFETAIDVAASVVSATSGTRSPVVLRMSNGREIANARSGDPQLILDELTSVEPDASRDLREDLLLLRNRPGATALVVVTGALDSGYLPLVGALRRKYLRLVVLAVSPSGAAPISYQGILGHIGTSADELCDYWNVSVAR